MHKKNISAKILIIESRRKGNVYAINGFHISFQMLIEMIKNTSLPGNIFTIDFLGIRQTAHGTS